MKETCEQAFQWIDFMLIAGVIGLLCMMILIAGVLAISDTRKLERQRWRVRKERAVHTSNPNQTRKS
jgi:hypothetical protein